VLAVSATYHPDASRRDIRQRAWALLATIAEPAASMREHADGEAGVFEVVTGIRDGSGPFAEPGSFAQAHPLAGSEFLTVLSSNIRYG
jgi:hypothetical protein